MLMGNPPFYDDDIVVLYQNIQEGNLVFPHPISIEGADLIKVFN